MERGFDIRLLRLVNDEGAVNSARSLVPINFRLLADEVSYIVKHSGADVLMIDPQLEDALAKVTAKHRQDIGTQNSKTCPSQHRKRNSVL